MRKRETPEGTFLPASNGDMGETVGILVVESLDDPERLVMLYEAYHNPESGVRSLGGSIVVPAHTLDKLSNALMRAKGAYERRQMMREWFDS